MISQNNTIETSSLYLIPGDSVECDEYFKQVLCKGVDFKELFDYELDEKYFGKLKEYLRSSGSEDYLYGIFLKDTKEYIGYIKLFREESADYEIEFYIIPTQRKKGYYEEACKAVIENGFANEISDDYVASVIKEYGKMMAEKQLMLINDFE